MNKITKEDAALLMDLILAEMETIRKVRIKFSDRELRETETAIEIKLKDIYSKLNSLDFEVIK